MNEEAKAGFARIKAAQLGCAICEAPFPARNPQPGEPFSGGPYRGRYWCMACWTLYWAEHPECFCDEESRKFNAQEAKAIRIKRGAEVLYEDGDSRVYLTPRGTVLFDIKSAVALGENEFDPERLSALAKAITAIREKMPEFSGAPA